MNNKIIDIAYYGKNALGENNDFRAKLKINGIKSIFDPWKIKCYMLQCCFHFETASNN